MKIAKFFQGINFNLILILFLSTVLVSIWFREGNIMGTAESGLPFYNLNLEYNSFKEAWASFALGDPTNITLSSVPSYWFLSLVQGMGIPPFLIQATFFWFVLVVSGFSILFLTKELFPQLKNKYLILAVFFYWFNLFSMVNVWNRFLNNFFVFYMFLPLSFLIFLKGLNKKKYVYAIIFGVISILFSYAFSSVAFNALLWFILLFTTFFHLLFSKEKSFGFYINFFFLTLFFWVCINLWWIGQTLSYIYSGSFQAVEKTSFSPSNNQLIFTILSEKLGKLIYILRFEHSSFFETSNLLWIKLYTNPLISFISFSLFLILIIPIILKKRNFSVIFLTSLLLIGVFLSQGNNPPFGQVLNLFFPKTAFLQAFRNAFEKFGFILPFAGAPLFAYGSFLLAENVFKKFKLYLLVIIFCWLLGVLGLPYFTGLVFTNDEMPTQILSKGYQVAVPKYYKEASDWLSMQKGNFRLLTFPLGTEGITYNWEKGYTGVELTNQLISTPAISFQTNIPFYDDLASDLENTFLNKPNFATVTNILNSRYIMFRNDIDWHARRMQDPQVIFNKLKDMQEKGQIKLAKDWGSLSLWEMPWEDRSIYVSNQITAVAPQPKISDSQFLASNSAVLMATDATSISMHPNQLVIHPYSRLSLEESPDNNYEGGQDIFPYAKFSPSSKFYQLLLLKEKLELNGIVNISQKVDFILSLLGKRLFEAKIASEDNKPEQVLTAMDNYKELLDYMSLFFPDYLHLKSDIDKQLINQEKFYRVFVKHKLLINEIASHFPGNSEMINKLQSVQKLIDFKLAQEKINPVFGFKETMDFPLRRRVDYEFSITDPGEYELMWGSNNWDKYYEGLDKPITLQFDNKLVPVQLVSNEYGYKSFGKIILTKGVHNIAINTPLEHSLITAPQDFSLMVDHGVKQFSFPIENYDPQAEYIISFDYFIKKGSGVEVSIESNNSLIKSGEIISDYWHIIRPEAYDFDQKHFSNTVKLNSTTKSATLFLKVRPWNDCESIFQKDKKKCKDSNIKRAYDRTTEVLIKNINVTRKLVDEPVLIRTSPQQNISLPEVHFHKISNTSYTVEVKNAVSPYILVLSELFDPGWQVFTDTGEKVSQNHFLINSYANGWQIQKKGTYRLIVRFVPQDLLIPTEIISGFFLVLGILFIGWRLRKK